MGQSFVNSCGLVLRPGKGPIRKVAVRDPRLDGLGHGILLRSIMLVDCEKESEIALVSSLP
jgi:hypothetical protein